MRLNLALNGVLIASARIDPARCKDETYLGAIRRLLRLRNQEALRLIPARPQFYIDVPSTMPALAAHDSY